MNADFRLLHAPAAVDWRSLDADRLLALLATSFPWDVRRAIAGERLVALATVSLLDSAGCRREPALATAVGGAAACSTDDQQATEADVPPDTGELLTAARWLAVGKGWRPLDAEEPGLRLAVPGEHDLPPIAVRSCPAGLRIERPLPLLIARDAAPVVRLATAHAALVLNASIRAARLAVRDPATLTFAAEFILPPGEPDEDELDCALEGVRHAAAYATGVLDCLRNPAVASEYATAHHLPAPPTERELR